jgi:hypothetical protein
VDYSISDLFIFLPAGKQPRIRDSDTSQNSHCDSAHASPDVHSHSLKDLFETACFATHWFCRSALIGWRFQISSSVAFPCSSCDSGCDFKTQETDNASSNIRSKSLERRIFRHCLREF